MKPVEKLQAEKERHAKVVEAGMGQTLVLREHMERLGLMSNEQQKDVYVNRMFAHKGHTTPPDSAQSSQQQPAAPVHSSSAAGTSGAAKPAAGSSGTKKQRKQAAATAAGSSEAGAAATSKASSSAGKVTATIGGAGTQALPPTQTLVAQVKAQQERDKAAADLRFEAKRQALMAEAASIEKQEEALQKRKVQKKRLNLIEAIKEDQRLGQMPTQQVLQEFLQQEQEQKEQRSAAGSRQSKQPNSSVAATPAGSVASRQAASQAATSRTQVHAAEEEDQDDDDDGLFSSDEEEEEEEEDDKESTPVQYPREHVKAEQVPVKHAATTGALVEELRAARAAPPQNAAMSKQKSVRKDQAPVTLDTLVEALQGDMHEQQQALHELRVKHQVAVTRLNWANHRPATYLGEWAMTAKQLTLKKLCTSLVHDMISEALSIVALRPTPGEVAAEVAVWKAKRAHQLSDLARHIADGVLKDCVDSIIAEVSGEVQHLETTADAFAFDMLVEAVAFSQKKFDFAHDDVRARLREMAQQQEENIANLEMARQAQQQRRETIRSHKAKSMAKASARSLKSMQSKSRSRAGAAQVAAQNQEYLGGAEPFPGGQSSDHGEEFVDGEGEEEEGGMGGHEGAQSEVSTAVVGPEPLDLTSKRLPERAIRLGSVTAFTSSLDEEDVYLLARTYNDKALAGDDKQHYILGLKSMLQEMRKLRAGAPYGHTQQLQIYWPRGIRVTKAQRAAATRIPPSLAAGSAVWKLRKALARRIHMGQYCKMDAVRASREESLFWGKVIIRPFFLGQNAMPLVYVYKKLAPITSVAASPSGAFLALGTATGAMLVFDLRNDPVNPWFQVLGDGSLYVRPWLLPNWRSKRPRNPAILSITWSADSYQLATLDGSSTLRVWWLRPQPGQVIKEEPERQPIVPELALSLGPLMSMISGKAPITEPLQEGAGPGSPNAGWASAPTSRQLRLCFHAAFNISGCQPSVLVPQITGDVLKVTTNSGAQLLPMPMPLLRAQAARGLGTGGIGGGLTQKTVEFLMPPQMPNKDVASQSLFRGHDGFVVFIGFLSDKTTLVSVDSFGVVHLWPASVAERTGFGWYRPSQTWRMPRSLRTYHPRGPAYPVYPRVSALPAGGFLSFLGLGPKPPTGSGSTKAPHNMPPPVSFPGRGLGGLDPLGTPMTFADLMADRGAWDDESEPTLLDEFPAAGFLVDRRLPWLTAYRWDTRIDKKGRLVKQEVHRPSTDSGPGRPLVISVTSLPDGTLLGRYKQYAVHTRLDYKVVSARLTPSERDLVVVASVPPQQGDSDSYGFFSFHVVSLATMKSTTPRIDVYDHSQGQAAPAYVITPTVTPLGSEYLITGLGCGVLGVHSLATGQLVRELSLGMPTTSPHFVALDLFTVSAAQGQCKNAGKTLLAAVPAGSQCVHLFEINDEVSTLDAVERRPQPPLVRVVPVPQPPPPSAEDEEGEIEYEEGSNHQQGVRGESSMAQTNMRGGGRQQPPAGTSGQPPQGPTQRAPSSVQGPPAPAQPQPKGSTPSSRNAGQQGSNHGQVPGQQQQRSQPQPSQQQQQPGQPPPLVQPEPHPRQPQRAQGKAGGGVA